MNNKVKFLRGTAAEYAIAEKDSDTIYFTTDDGKLYIGDKEISGSDIIIDDTLSDTSTNPVQNKVVKQAIDNKADKTVATTSADGLMSAEDKSKLDSADNTYALKSKYGDTTINVGRMVNAPIGEYSTSLGIGTVASGYASTAEGAGSQASELASHAGGYGSKAIKKCSFAHGYEVYAKHDYETAFGKHNVTNDDTLFSIGDGVEINTDGSISIARHNAFEITTSGGKLHDKDIAVDVSNPNLLINPDFKINQRGVSGTFSETGKYFVDRWRLVSGAVTVNADGTLTLNGTISQIFENAVGDNVTASVSAGTATYDDSTKTFSITANGEIISWAKLEHGSNATQFFPPDKATELLKCMRYYEILIPSGADRAVTGYLETGRNAIFDMKFSVQKRCVPSLTSNSVRIIVNTFDSYLAMLNNCPVIQSETDKHGIVIASTDPVISSVSSGYIGVTMDAMHNANLAVDAEIY